MYFIKMSENAFFYSKQKQRKHTFSLRAFFAIFHGLFLTVQVPLTLVKYLYIKVTVSLLVQVL